MVTAFPKRNQIPTDLREAEFRDSIHRVSDYEKPRRCYSWTAVNTIKSNPVVSAEAEGLAGKALVYTKETNLLKYMDVLKKPMRTFLL